MVDLFMNLFYIIFFLGMSAAVIIVVLFMAGLAYSIWKESR